MAHSDDTASVFRRLGIATEPEKKSAREDARDRVEAAKDEAMGKARHPKRRLGKRLTARALEARGKGRRDNPQAAKSAFAKVRNRALAQGPRAA